MGDAQSTKESQEVEAKAEKTDSSNAGNENEDKMEDAPDKRTAEAETEINLNDEEDKEDIKDAEREKNEKEKSSDADQALKDRRPSLFDSLLNIFSETFAINKQEDNAPGNPEQETQDEKAASEHDDSDKDILVEEDIEIVVVEEAKQTEESQENVNKPEPRRTLIERLQSLFREPSRERDEKTEKKAVVYNAEDDTVTAETDPKEGDADTAKTDLNEEDAVAQDGARDSSDEVQDSKRGVEETTAKSKQLKKLLPCCKEKSEN